jgi:hypothetical protein|nr:MAG TPA: hypothetical protein [Caudoviricetes sp.]
MTIDEAIAHAREEAKMKMAEYENHYDKDNHYYPQQCKRRAEEYEQIAEWLEELKSLREYKERMEMQYLDDIDNPLEPLKLQSAIQSEIFKFNYRKEHKPQDINILDYTVMAALKYCLEEQLKAGGESD